MIYTVTFNPSLDYIVSVKGFALGKTNRTEEEFLLPGGKGINVSTVLRSMGVESTAFGYVAGFTGEEIVRRLSEMGVRTKFIPVEEGMSRINVKLKSSEGTEINGNGPSIPEEKLQLLLQQLDELKEGDVLVLAGSIPASLPNSIYRQMMARLDGRGILMIVDATQELLRKVLPHHPFLIKPNHHELGEFFGVELTTRESVVAYGKQLQEMGARNVLISLAGEGAVLVAENQQVYSAPAPQGTLVNAVGAGDSMVAGFLKGWLERGDYAHAFYMGLAAGSASAFSNQFASKDEIEELYEQLLKTSEGSEG